LHARAYAEDFGPFDGRIWLNCSHQGPLPKVAAAAVATAVRWKVAPFPLADSNLFERVPSELRRSLARLINASPDEIILGNSASYGLSVLARGIRWKAGDEVLLVENDFPASLYPWLPLREQGVAIRFLRPAGRVLQPGELEAALRPETRLFCATWVHSFVGEAVDASAFGTLCRRNDTLFVLNASQGLGARPLDVRAMPADAVTSCGFKYLCGPYGTGFCWISPSVRNRMRPVQGYWLANMTADDLKAEVLQVRLREDLGARAFDVFGTANFFNFVGWTASVDYLLAQGIDRVAAYDQELVGRLINGLVAADCDVESPHTGDGRTTIVVFPPPRGADAGVFGRALQAAGIYAAVRQSRIRLSPHLFNTATEIDRALEAVEHVVASL
jgi:cysteine desulfurase/selenocysteine lyase